MSKTQGIVLKEIRFKETSKILNIYTKKFGRIHAMARGAYKPKSQLIANTQPFSLNEYDFYKGKNFYYITQADIIDSFYSIRENMEKLIYGYYMLELVEKSTPEEEENEKLFLLLEKGLRVLSKLDKDFLKFIVSYELKFISFLGYKPYIEKCVVCKNEDTSNIKFSIKEGGIICSNCSIMEPYSERMDKYMYEVMKTLLYTPLNKIIQINIPKDVMFNLHDILVKYILYNIDRKEFNSLNLMKSLENNGGC
ncbi:DNA repair protein RecO [Tissierella simiarum]|nr:DNA repair protein RecO [Tissierella simiarum]